MLSSYGNIKNAVMRTVGSPESTERKFKDSTPSKKKNIETV